MNTCALLLMVLCQDNADNLWKFPVKTYWKYKQTRDAEEITTTMTVTGVEGGKVHMDSVDQSDKEKEPRPTEKMLAFAEGGFVKWGEIKDGKEKVVLHIFKIGAKAGDTWKTPFLGEEGMEVDVKHMGEKTVTLGKTSYKAIHCQFVHEDKQQGITVTGNYWLAPGVGMIQFEIKVKAGEQENTNKFELIETSLKQ